MQNHCLLHPKKYFNDGLQNLHIKQEVHYVFMEKSASSIYLYFKQHAAFKPETGGLNSGKQTTQNQCVKYHASSYAYKGKTKYVKRKANL